MVGEMSSELRTASELEGTSAAAEYRQLSKVLVRNYFGHGEDA